MIRLIKNIYSHLLKNSEDSEPYMVSVGYILMVFYPGFYFFNSILATPSGYENLGLRLIIGLFGATLVLKKYWPAKLKKFLPIYWHFILVFTLPFFFSFMLLNNQHSTVWHVNGLVGLVLLTFFVDFIAYTILVLLGAGAALILYCSLNKEFFLAHNLIGVIGSYTAPIIYFLIFSNKRTKIESEKLAIVKFSKEELEKIVSEQTKELQHALAVKTRILNNISHEVKTPLHGVWGIVRILADKWQTFTDNERLENVKKVAKNTERLVSYINNILDLSKFSSGKMVFEFKTINIIPLIEEIIDECKDLYVGNKDIEIKLYANTSDTIYIKADQDRLMQVLRNLFANAIRYMEKGKIVAEIKQLSDNIIEVSIADEGIGVPENELKKIFEPFYQSTKTANKAGGTGLGLAICKEIVEAHQGKIWAENNKNKGAKFYCTLPIDSAIQVIPNISVETPVVSQSVNAKPKTILLIDDEEATHDLFKLLIKTYDNCEIVNAYGGKEGLEVLKEKGKEIDIVFLDLMMPDVYGLDVLKEIRTSHQLNVPVILQSGANIEELEKAQTMGISGCLSKPYSQHSILNIIKSL
ncbi:MAG: hybrid sensor histidine kinase/response regulator [Sphingobacteriia bacterium]|nr:hybrid sensor histidine kinase/response regulator [Sphingobacteriia bacterium]